MTTTDRYRAIATTHPVASVRAEARRLMTPAWEAIREPYLYGSRVRLGTHMAEVVRAESGSWLLFCYPNGSTIPDGSGPTAPMSYPTARRVAGDWNRGQA